MKTVYSVKRWIIFNCPSMLFLLIMVTFWEIILLSISRAWESLSDATCSKSLVIVYDKRCILQIGYAATLFSGTDDVISVDVDKLMQGSLYQGLMKSKSRKKQIFTHLIFFFFCLPYHFQKFLIFNFFFFLLFAESYLANLSLYPAKSELPFLPSNTQVLIIFLYVLLWSMIRRKFNYLNFGSVVIAPSIGHWSNISFFFFIYSSKAFTRFGIMKHLLPSTI